MCVRVKEAGAGRGIVQTKRPHVNREQANTTNGTTDVVVVVSYALPTPVATFFRRGREKSGWQQDRSQATAVAGRPNTSEGLLRARRPWFLPGGKDSIEVRVGGVVWKTLNAEKHYVRAHKLPELESENHREARQEGERG